MQTEAIITHIVNWLSDYSKSARTNGFVVGVSGGIDSAVTSALCARTGLPTLLLDLPIRQSSGEVSRSKKHIEQIQAQFENVGSKRIQLTQAFDNFVDSLPETTGGDRDLALANARARLRMTTLYYFAGLENKLVAGTGNKVEDFGVGFFTKYGDGGVDLSPIADLMKTEVYELGKALGVDPDILEAQPTDGLWGDARTDEDQIGASYPELEWAMTFDGDESHLNNREQEVLEIYRKFHRANRHKMEPIPVCEIPEKLKD